MNEAETAILRQFRLYNVRAREMLFLNHKHSKAHSAGFARALHSLILKGLLIKELRRDAYSLTDIGYAASLSA